MRQSEKWAIVSVFCKNKNSTKVIFGGSDNFRGIIPVLELSDLLLELEMSS